MFTCRLLYSCKCTVYRYVKTCTYMYIIMNNILKKFRQFLLQMSSQLKSKVEEYAMTSEIEFIFFLNKFSIFSHFSTTKYSQAVLLLCCIKIVFFGNSEVWLLDFVR